MSNYIPGGEKKSKIFRKREAQLVHAIKNEFSDEKIISAVEQLREAKLQAIKVQPSSRKGNASVWLSYTVEELIDIYSKNISN